MITIIQDQAFQRWDTLPDNLRNALCDETSSDFIWKTCKDEHIPDEKIYSVARIVGYVLMGFLHPDDAAKEIQDVTGVDLRIANSIASAITPRIFTPLRASIDGIYEPAGSSWFKSKISGDAGEPMMIIKDVKKETQTGKSSPVPPTPGKKSEAHPPEPLILQGNTPFEVNRKSADFHVEISDDKMKGLSKAPRFAPVKLAVLELGENKEKNSPPKPAGGPSYQGEFNPFSSFPKISKEKSGGAIPLPGLAQTPEKNRTITEIKSPIPTPGKIQNEQIILKTALPKPQIPSPTSTFIPRPFFTKNVSEAEPPAQFLDKKIVPPSPASVVPPTKMPSMPNPFGGMPKEASMPVVIQKNYSAAGPTQKTPSPMPVVPTPPSPMKISTGNSTSQMPPIRPVIRKDYSEADLTPKISTPALSNKTPTPSPTTTPKPPTPPQK